MRRGKTRLAPLLLAAALLLTGCGPGGVDQALSGIEDGLKDGLKDGLNKALTDIGSIVDGALDDLQNAEYKGGPFENNIESARDYLLGQLREKYGVEFAVMGRENLTNYGAFAGASYSCEVAPVDAPERVTMALVSQTAYQKVRDGYAVYFFEDEALAPALALCEGKDYVLDQRVSLEMSETEKTWTAEDDPAQFFAESGAYVWLVLRFPDDLDTQSYAEYLHDFIGGIDGLPCGLLLQAKANKAYLFHREFDVLNGIDTDRYTVEWLKEEIEETLSIGQPR